MNKRFFVLGIMTAGALGVLSAAHSDAVPDATPGACVDCHVKGAGGDLRLSVLMAALAKQVDPGLLARSQAAAPKSAKLKGKHPNVAAMLKSIPDGCLKCHTKTSKTIPALSQLMHVIHLAPGAEHDAFVKAAGACASCHKLDPSTGAQPVPSGPEK